MNTAIEHHHRFGFHIRRPTVADVKERDTAKEMDALMVMRDFESRAEFELKLKEIVFSKDVDHDTLWKAGIMTDNQHTIDIVFEKAKRRSYVDAIEAIARNTNTRSSILDRIARGNDNVYSNAAKIDVIYNDRTDRGTLDYIIANGSPRLKRLATKRVRQVERNGSQMLRR